jgi:hypothetical protein
MTIEEQPEPLPDWVSECWEAYSPMAKSQNRAAGQENGPDMPSQKEFT